MEELSAVKYEEKKSRFFAHLYLIDSPSEYHDIIEIHKKNYRKAAHHCSAMNYSDANKRIFQEFKSDGEVGHPGRVLMAVLQNNGLCSHVLVVSRIFGGIRLGPAGVSRAFKDVGEMCAGMNSKKEN